MELSPKKEKQLKGLVNSGLLTQTELNGFYKASLFLSVAEGDFKSSVALGSIIIGSGAVDDNHPAQKQAIQSAMGEKVDPEDIDPDKDEQQPYEENTNNDAPQEAPQEESPAILKNDEASDLPPKDFSNRLNSEEN